ncbi:hypothetical protein [Chitiniphilus eburneus]|uniref:Transporter n=1 Tax=Chitiniphilus eburneus TaxID=2571148 RepID=A0A4U0PY69_9NEIS|nr:hypothetical protein [Chitiniphilus eburneus]TJZ73517.1 hypothetical protein FAZ21_10000 [Chitiniphilus eburneus]
MNRVAPLAGLLILSSAMAPLHAAPGIRLDVTPIWLGTASLDGEGKARTSSLLLNAATDLPVDDGFSVGLNASYQYIDWEFRDPLSWNGQSPWGNVQRAGLGINLNWRTGDWQYTLAPSLSYAGELGADRNDSMGLGVTAVAARSFTPDLTVGLGVGLFNAIDETRVYPYLMIDWNIDEQWHLSNPFSAGPAGPAGLELGYRGLGNKWDIGAGGAYRSFRFRLARDNALASGGVGQEEMIPLYVRFGYTPSRNTKLDLYLGAALNGKLRTEDSNGNLLTEDEFDATPLFSINFGGQF